MIWYLTKIILVFVLFSSSRATLLRYEEDPTKEWMVEQARDKGDTKTLQTSLSYLAICLIVRNEHANILHFLRYHLYIGFNKIYIFDNGSQPPMLNILLPYINSGQVSYMYILDDWRANDYGLGTKETVHRNSVQRWSYSSCVRWFGHRHQFIANIDVDEYIVMRDDEDNIKINAVQFFKDYEEYSAVQLHWRVFGSSNRIQRTNLPPLVAYTQCAEQERALPMQRFSKSIVNTQYFKGTCHVHECGGSGTQTVDTLKRWWGFERTQRDVTWHGAFIHHYVVMSEEDYRIKIERGQAHTNNQKKGWGMFYNINNYTKGNCTYMIPIAEQCCL